MKIILLFTIICVNIIPYECNDMKNPVPPEYKPFPKWGCPAPDPPIECVSKQTSCIHEEKNNVYRVVKTRTWWHCGE